MYFDLTAQGYVIRVRLLPNSSCCKASGILTGPDGEEYLKISVTVVPEKGKANRELIAFLSKRLKRPKSAFAIISGSQNHWKKISVTPDENTKQKLLSLTEETI